MLKSGKLKHLSVKENLLLATPYDNNITIEANHYIKESQFEFLASVDRKL